MWTQQRGPVLTSSVAHSAAHSPFVAPNQPTMVSSNSRPGWPQAGGCRGWGATHLPTSLLHLVLATDAPLRPGVSRGTHPSENAQGRMVSVAGFSSVSNVGLARGKPSVCGPANGGPPGARLHIVLTGWRLFPMAAQKRWDKPTHLPRLQQPAWRHVPLLALLPLSTHVHRRESHPVSQSRLSTEPHPPHSHLHTCWEELMQQHQDTAVRRACLPGRTCDQAKHLPSLAS